MGPQPTAQELGFVSGHDFSRAVNIENMSGFSPCLSCPVPNFSAVRHVKMVTSAIAEGFSACS
jgi:hypothetical protein